MNLALQQWYGTERDARRLTRHSLAYNALLYLHFCAAWLGWLPLWTMWLSAPILVVRWMLAVHELFHLRDENEVDAVTRLLPLMLTPVSLGYREFHDIHQRHHRHMATKDDPEYYQLRGSKLRGFLNACSAPEQALMRWVACRGIDGELWRGATLRFILFAAMAYLTWPVFLWYWLPVRFAYGMSYFSFFYCLHRSGDEYGVYPLHFPRWAERLFGWLFGQEALHATCHHDMHHSQPRVAANHLPSLRNLRSRKLCI